MTPAPVDTPVAGYYRMPLRMGSHPVGICIWFGQPREPWTGEIMDRAPRWQATANGEYIDLDRVWPKCLKDPIDKAEHDRLAALQAWGQRHAPDSPQANPRSRIDLLTAPLPL